MLRRDVCDVCEEPIETQDPITCAPCTTKLLDDADRLDWIEAWPSVRLLDVRGHLQNNPEDDIRAAIDKLIKLQEGEPQ